MPPPKHELRTWTLHHADDNNTYTVSTDPSLLDLTALNDAFASDMLYWAKRMDPDTLQLCVEQSLCFGLYLNDDGSLPPSYPRYPYPTHQAPSLTPSRQHHHPPNK